MKPEEALRQLRAADRWEPMEPRFLATLPQPESDSEAPRRPDRLRSSSLRIGLVTAVVLALLAIGTGSILYATGFSAPAVGASSTTGLHPTPTPTSTPGTVGALPAVAGRVLATWTDQSRLPVVATLDAGGQAVAITFSCTGGGVLRYSIVGRSDSAQGCGGITSGGPELTAKNGKLVAEHQVTVHLSVEGHPRFAVRVIAVPVTVAPTGPPASGVQSSGPAVPASLRTCEPADLASTGSYQRFPHFEGGLITVTSAASTDCAIRSWPTLRYLDSTGKSIGAPAHRDGIGTAAPVRLGAHGTAYVEVELFRMDRLTDCDARQVAALALQIGAARVRIPVPSDPAVGKCTNPDVSADGVGPATAYRPTSP